MLTIALQMDPLHQLNKQVDSTLELARAAASRGAKLFHYEPQQLRMDLSKGRARITARGHALVHRAGGWSLGQESVVDLAGFDFF